MGRISVVSINVDNIVSEIVKRVQTDIIDASAASRDNMVGIIENSAGDFIESFKTEMAGEVEVISAVGELLMEMANYVQSAAHAFTNVDTVYSNSEAE